MNIFTLVICVFLCLSCNEDSNHYSEIITEVFTVVKSENQYKQGPLKFSESYIYAPNGQEYQHIIYNQDKTIRGVEKADFIEGSELASGSTFKDGQDSLLSYYKFTFDDKDRLYKKIGFDASNDEMLRIELYHYNDSDHLIAKEIRSADDKFKVYTITRMTYMAMKSLLK